MNQNAKALLVGALTISLALIVFGLGFDVYETGKFQDCTPSIAHRCALPNRGGLVVFAVGAIATLGVLAAWISLRRNAAPAADR